MNPAPDKIMIKIISVYQLFVLNLKKSIKIAQLKVRKHRNK